MNQEQTIQNLKDTCVDKLSQGDLNIYRLKERPNLETDPHRTAALVTGDQGHTHSVIAKAIGRIKGKDQFVVEVGKDGAEFSHDGKHQPAFHLEEGFYFVDRAREKGMLNDMVAPVSD